MSRYRSMEAIKTKTYSFSRANSSRVARLGPLSHCLPTKRVQVSYSRRLLLRSPWRDQYPDQAQHPSRVGAFLPSCSAGESPGLSPLMESAPLQRERLHAERPEEIQSSTAKVADVTTANLEAWRHYVQGLRGEDAMRNGIAL